MTLLDRLFRRGRHAGPRLLTGRRARRTQASVTEARTALPTVAAQDRAATLEHIRRHWRVEDAHTGTIPPVDARAADDQRWSVARAEDHELVRGHVAAHHRARGGW